VILDRLFRAQSRTLTSADLARLLAARSTSSAGVAVTPERAMALSAVFSCVRVLAESVGQLPVHLYEKRGREKQKAEDHPLHDVLHFAPNKFQTAQEWREWLMACLGTWGNAYCRIVRVGPSRRLRVGELLPIHPAAVRPKYDASAGEMRYHVALEGGGEDVFTAEDVMHIPLFSLGGGVGVNPVQYAREAIGLGIGAETFGARLFANGAQPGGVLQVPKVLSDKAYERLKSSWEERHQGGDNAHKPAILEEGMTWQSVGFSAEDAQFLETRKHQRSEIAGMYRVPPHLIGDLDKATFSNIEHQSLDFVVRGLLPYVTRIEQRIIFHLLPPDERRRYFPRINVAGLLRGDMQARAAYYHSLVQDGVLSPNEIRDLEDLNPREGGDIYLTPLNMAVNGKPPADE
jgi:HK97 family phage portal protein